MTKTQLAMVASELSTLFEQSKVSQLEINVILYKYGIITETKEEGVYNAGRY